MTALPVACRVSPRADTSEPSNPIWFQSGVWVVTSDGLRAPGTSVSAGALGMKDRPGVLSWPRRLARSHGNSSDFMAAFRVACALHRVNVTAAELDAAEAATQCAGPPAPAVALNPSAPCQKVAATMVNQKQKKPTGPPAPAAWALLPSGDMTNGKATIAADRLSSPEVLAEVFASEPMGLDGFLALWPAGAGYPAEVKAARKSVRVWHFKTFHRKLA
ncbi:hypothetical protein [Rhodopila sp.]|uniref:hypothetical protein n=1 Tax=Rhodopila sp. TaxID=2480087 RepID=UPI003D143C28